MADTTHTVEQDIASLKTHMARVKEDVTSLKMDVAGIKAKMESFATKADLEAVKGELKTDIERMGRILIMWNVSSMIALVGIVVAIVRLLR